MASMASSLGISYVCHTLELSVILLLDGIETLTENRRTGHG